MQEDENYIGVYKEEYRNDFEKMTGGYKDYRLSKKDEKKTM